MLKQRAYFVLRSRGSFMSGVTSSTSPPRCSSPIVISAAGGGSSAGTGCW